MQPSKNNDTINIKLIPISRDARQDTQPQHNGCER